MFTGKVSSYCCLHLHDKTATRIIGMKDHGTNLSLALRLDFRQLITFLGQLTAFSSAFLFQ